MFRAKDILSATSGPHALRTQPVASPWIFSTSLQMQGTSVVVHEVSFLMESSRHVLAQVGISARVWALARAAKATRAAEVNFIMEVVKRGVCVCVCLYVDNECALTVSEWMRKRGEGGRFNERL